MNDLLTYLLGGGFASALLGLFTIRSRIRKIRAETEALNLENSAQATEILMNNIVEPLKQELYEMRKEMALLRAAIRDAKYCRYAADCPIMSRLRESKEHASTAHDDTERRIQPAVSRGSACCRGPDSAAY